STSEEPVFVIVDPLTVNLPTACVPKFTPFGLALRTLVTSTVAAEATPPPMTRAARQMARTLFMGDLLEHRSDRMEEAYDGVCPSSSPRLRRPTSSQRHRRRHLRSAKTKSVGCAGTPRERLQALRRRALPVQWAHLGSNQGPPACEAESGVPTRAAEV